MYTALRRSILFLCLLLIPGFAIYAQLVVVDNQTATQLVERLTGSGVTVLNPTLTCPGLSNAVFNGTSNLGIDSGIILTSGRAMTSPAGIGVNGPNTGGPGPDFDNGAPGDPALNNILAGLQSNNACVLEFDFVPAGDSVKFDYVFASSEYQTYSCSQWNDMFAFLISGPGFTTPYNMALVPGTTVPVCVNSTTSIIPNGGVNPCNSNNCTPCTSMAAGSPFSAFYINNTGGASITYRGFTTPFTAKAEVSPCDTYHLKLAIADGSAGGNDVILDSGVFLKAGSLSSTSLKVQTFGGGGLERPFTNTVRGCPPGLVRVSRNGSLGQAITIPLSITGTAVNGVDYNTLPSSVTMPAGDSVVNLFVNGIPMNPAVGPKSVIISILSPYTCSSTNEPIVLSSDTIMIYDSVYVKIITPDTAICRGRSVNLTVDADTALDFLWSPAATVSDPLAQNVTVTPTDPTTYIVQVTLPVGGSGCAPSTAQIKIDVKDTPRVDLGPDKATCGDAVQLYASTSPPNPDERFSWTPVTGLSDPEIRNPMATPPTTTDYAVKVNPGAIGCDGYDTIRVRLLPDHITVLNNDTAVCAGTVIPLRADGDTAFSYNWTPEPDIADPLAPNTTLLARTSGYYTLTASYPGCIDMPDSFYVEVQPVPDVNIGPDKVICSYDTIQLYAAVMPTNYPNYSYHWSPGAGLTDSTAQLPVFSGDASVPELTVKVTTPLGCEGSDTMVVTVFAGDFLTVVPDTGACPPVSIPLLADGATNYTWSPDDGLDHADIANPVASPVSPTQYTVLGAKVYGNHTCYDTQMVMVNVYPQASVTLPDSVQLWPGESYQLDPAGNCLYFQWFPPSGLSADNISNPVAQPEVRTRYFVTARTEYGCIIKDSIDVLVNTESLLDVPNAFTPTSGDFTIVRRGIAHLKYFRIFNRWGNKVFETSNIDQGWNGRFNDKEQPMGVYIYSIEATTNTGKPFRKDGNVTLIR
ncbi:choice-of-anchor L domain-containing protein [Taibaiella helva]|uniref:choice-of-anchor L domain-containing protein n=1 Tax=Taibaiella helva TaxID=2301235 RepID=UPI000E574A07|nr:choice-of-anchor L domain-containing protein [Taibaiella helva]